MNTEKETLVHAVFPGDMSVIAMVFEYKGGIKFLCARLINKKYAERIECRNRKELLFETQKMLINAINLIGLK